MKVLLLGRNGQVGFELQRTLLSFGPLTALSRSEADLNAPNTLTEVLRATSPDVIVNAAAYTAVDKAESDSETAFRVNADAPGVLARYAKDSGALLVHFSTDYVFDGSSKDPHLETDPANPLSVYGKSKLAGEEAIQASGCDALILRTSWVYGLHGSNFIKTILKLARERQRLEVVADQTGAPTSAELLADVTALALGAWAQQRLPVGIYHLAASGQTTWHALAAYAIDQARVLGAELSALDVVPITTEQFPKPAKRPLNSLFSLAKIQDALALELPDWRLHVLRFLNQIHA